MDNVQSGWLQPYEASGVLVPGLAEFARLEQRASRIRHISTLLVPGFLQTEQYATGVIRLWPAIRASDSETPLRTLLRFRLDRQWHLFEREVPPQTEVIIDESALLRRIDDKQTMYEQIIHLRKLADLPHITLQIIPLAVPFSYLSAVGATSAVLLSFPDPARPEVLSVEDTLGPSHNIENLHETRAFKLEFLALQERAMSAEQSREHLDRLAERMLTGADVLSGEHTRA